MKINLTVTWLSLAGGLPALIALLAYAWQVWYRKALPSSFASFLMWTCMDVLLVVNALRTGQPIWMPLGFTIGAATVTYVLWKRSPLAWTKDETLTALCASGALSLTFMLDGAWAQFWSTFAMSIAGWPALRENWKMPVRATFPMWFGTVVGCVFTLYGDTKHWDSWSAFTLPLMCSSYNALMAIVVLRSPSRAPAPAAIPVAT